MTNSSENPDSSVMMSSVIPSAKYSCSGSPLTLAKAGTAIEGLSGRVRVGFGEAAASGTPTRSRENLHLVERWTRTSPTELAYELTIEDPTVWVRPWTVKREFTRQSDEENKIYYEPRCIEGNYALPGMLRGARMEETAFAEGRGPNPATKDKTIGNSGVAEDPLEIPR
jgi:hypothetical protein